jgi:chemotaxis protein methyltransferase WspC
MNLARVEAVLRRRIGLDPGSLGAAFARAVAGRMRAAGVATADAYAGLLAADPAEWSALLGELVVPETWFFRGGRPLFDHLARWVRDRAAGRVVRVLSVPCSTGEEPYSLAIALADAGVPAAAVRIDAVDLSDDHLRRAAAGRYGGFSFREAGPGPRPGYFTAAGGGQWELAPAIRAMVRLGAGNVADDGFLAGEPPYHLIVCRNLLIYLTDEARGRALGHLDRLLAADGLLVLTAAEADNLPPGRFVADGPAGFCLYRRAAPGSASGGREPPDAPTIRGLTPPARRDQPGGSRPPLAKNPPEPMPTPAPDVAQPDPEPDIRRLADAGRLDEARAACERALAAAPSAGLHSLGGVIHLASGRPDEAAAAFRKALYLDPGHPEALDHMAALAEGRGDRPAAAAFRRRLARRNPEELGR